MNDWYCLDILYIIIKNNNLLIFSCLLIRAGLIRVLMCLLLLVHIKHMCQDILCIFQSLRHLIVIRFKCGRQRIGRSFSFFIRIGHHSAFTAQYNFCMVLEAHLHYLIRQSKHNRMSSSHPLLHIDIGTWLLYTRATFTGDLRWAGVAFRLLVTRVRGFILIPL